MARLPKADLERLIALQPDLVVVSEYTDPDFLNLLERSGLRYHRMQGLRDLPGYRKAILDLGVAVGASERAQALVARYDAVLAELARRLRGARPPAGHVLGQRDDGGRGHRDRRADRVGGRAQRRGRDRRRPASPPWAASARSWPIPTSSSSASGRGRARPSSQHPLLSKLRAVREGRIVEMPTELLVTLSHHAADASWYLAWALHPDRVPTSKP